MRKMGLEPTRHECHKILSLARLPVPTLPQKVPIFKGFQSSSQDFFKSIAQDSFFVTPLYYPQITDLSIINFIIHCE